MADYSVPDHISPNRGLECKPLPNGGPMIVMVKSEPGVWYDSRGQVVEHELAQKAGFNVAQLLIEKRRREAINARTEEINQQFEAEQAALRNMNDDQIESYLASKEADAEAAAKAARDAESAAKAADDGAPFVEKNSSGQPRRARVVQDGPIREMVFDQTAKVWDVFEDGVDAPVKTGLEKDAAESFILAEE